jgi:hypothetical protein
VPSAMVVLYKGINGGVDTDGAASSSAACKAPRFQARGENHKMTQGSPAHQLVL